MKPQSSFLFMSGVLILVVLMASRPKQQTFDKITVREFELVDKNGKERASILVEENGEVVFRLRDKSGTIRLKMGADEDGSGLVLLDNNTEPGIHALAKKSGSMISVLGKDGKKRDL